MYGIKPLELNSMDQDAACDVCSNKHLSLFSLGEYCKVYDTKACCFSELAKEKVQLCKNCISALRKTKAFQTTCGNAQKNMEAQLTIIYNYQGQSMQRTLAQLLYDTPSPIQEVPTDPVEYRRLLTSSLLRSC